MPDPHVTLSLTFRTPAAGVLEHVLTAVNRSTMPYQLVSTHCDSFDLDEVED